MLPTDDQNIRTAETVTESVTVDQDDSDNRDYDYYQASLIDGYRGLKGIICATLISEVILKLSKITGDVPLIFALVGLLFAIRHLLQIWQAKQQLRQLQ